MKFLRSATAAGRGAKQKTNRPFRRRPAASVARFLKSALRAVHQDENIHARE
jgi:hypothetical protein